MADVYKIRLANLRALIDQWGGPTTLAQRLGHSNGSFLAQLAGPAPSRPVTEKTARKIEEKVDLPPGWLDKTHKDDAKPAPRKAGVSVNDLDADLLAHCISLVTSVIEESNAKLSSSAVAEIVTMAYQQGNAGALDETYIRRLIRLAAR